MVHFNQGCQWARKTRKMELGPEKPEKGQKNGLGPEILPKYVQNLTLYGSF